MLTGGVGHDFEGTTGALCALLAAEGITSKVSDDPAQAFDALARDHWDLFVVNALRWRMLAERYAPLRDAWAITTPPNADAALAAHLAHGGGVLATHTGIICFDDWAGWAAALGAGWDWEDDRSFHPLLGPVDIRVAGGGTMPLVDEVYGFLALAGVGRRAGHRPPHRLRPSPDLAPRARRRPRRRRPPRPRRQLLRRPTTCRDRAGPGAVGRWPRRGRAAGGAA